MERNEFLFIGEEAARGTKQVGTGGFFPTRNFSLPQPDYSAKKRGGYRGGDALRGATLERRWGEKWDGLDPELEAYTEAGSTPGMFGTLYRHFFGTVNTTASGTGADTFSHMFYDVQDPFASGYLGAKALTFSMNAKHETVQKNYPYTGGRVKSLKFHQEPGDALLVTLGTMGQKLLTPEAGIASPVFPAESLLLRYTHLTVRAGGVVTRTGVAPNFTDITSTGDIIKPHSVDIEIDRGMVDKQLLDGTDTPGKTSVGIIKGTLSMKVNLASPGSGFSSIAEWLAFLGGVSSTNMLLTWDTGVAAGSGGNHMLIIDLPTCNRLGEMPDFSNLEEDPIITLKYDFHFNSTAGYLFGLLLRNTAPTV